MFKKGDLVIRKTNYLNTTFVYHHNFGIELRLRERIKFIVGEVKGKAEIRIHGLAGWWYADRFELVQRDIYGEVDFL